MPTHELKTQENVFFDEQGKEIKREIVEIFEPTIKGLITQVEAELWEKLEELRNLKSQ